MAYTQSTRMMAPPRVDGTDVVTTASFVRENRRTTSQDPPRIANDVVVPAGTSQVAPEPDADFPSCPGANNTLQIDNLRLQYLIHCNTDNSYGASTSVQISRGGYASCFTPCSASVTCVGFTFLGNDDGICYLKNALPAAAYIPKNGTNYITCEKVNGIGATSTPSSGGSNSSRRHSSTNPAVIGGVVGGVIMLSILCFFSAWYLIQRRRGKARKLSLAITHHMQGPIEVHCLSKQKYQRANGTGNDVFAPYGGFYRGTNDQSQWPAESEPPAETESGKWTTLPDAASVRPTSWRSPPHSPRFHEDIAELDSVAASVSRRGSLRRAPAGRSSYDHASRVGSPSHSPIKTDSEEMAKSNVSDLYWESLHANRAYAQEDESHVKPSAGATFTESTLHVRPEHAESSGDAK